MYNMKLHNATEIQKAYPQNENNRNCNVYTFTLPTESINTKTQADLHGVQSFFRKTGGIVQE